MKHWAKMGKCSAALRRFVVEYSKATEKLRSLERARSTFLHNVKKWLYFKNLAVWTPHDL